MGKLKKIARYLTVFITLLWSLFTIQSCSIKEDFSKCENEEEDFLLYIKVVDIVTGKDITENKEVENAYIHLFDQNKKFVRTYEVSASQIAERVSIIVKHDELDGAFISAWGNLTEEVAVSHPETGNQPNKLAVSLLKNSEENEYDLSPNDFFFGMKEVNQHAHTTHTEEVVITQKNAKLHITVKGLTDQDANNFYFKIAQQYNGYTFNGQPITGNSQIKEKGIFNNKDLVSPNPHLLIHSPVSTEATEENSVWIHLYYEKTGEETIEVVNTNKDITGNYIMLTSGKTTNVLMDIRDDGKINIYVEVTPWDKIYQWSEF